MGPNIKSNSNLWGKVLVSGFAICSLVCGCQTTKKASEEAEKIQFVIEKGAIEPNTGAIPQYIPVYVKTMKGQEVVDKKLGYRGWDFNKDGRIDMLEILDDKGLVSTTAFDFDLDGTVDLKLTDSPK